MTSWRWFGVWCVWLAGTADAASFDCKKAQTPQEKAICGSPELSKADEELAAAYKKAVGQVSPAAQAGMRSDEANWLRYVATICEAARAQPAAELANCMVGEYRGRAETLEGAVQRGGNVTFFARTKSLAIHNAKGERDDLSGGHYGELTAVWPQADSNEGEWTAFNKAVATEALAFAGAAEGRKSAGWTPSLASEAEQDISASVEYMDPLLVTVEFANDMMGHGAAHPNESWERLHWLRHDGRELRVADIFQTGPAWKKAVAGKCLAALKQQFSGGEGIPYGDAEARQGVDTTISSPRNWKLSNEGLTIVFPEYSVAPRVSPVDDVTIPWRELKPYFSSNFVAPSAGLFGNGEASKNGR